MLRKWNFQFISFLIGVLLTLGFLQKSQAEILDITVGTLGPACRICNNMIKAKLKRVPGIDKVIHNLKDSTFTLIHKGGQPLHLEGMKNAVEKSGYTFHFIELTMVGIVAEIGGTFTFKEPITGQTFRLVQGEKIPLSPEKLSEIKTLSSSGKKPLEIRGKAYPREPMDALEALQVGLSQGNL